MYKQMKKIILIAIFCIILSSCNSIYLLNDDLPDVPTDPGEGSVIHLSMNNTINNSINNSVNMTLSSGIENYTTGMFNASFRFDGTTQINSTNIDTSGWSGYTVCFWLNLSTSAAIERFIRFDHNGAGRFNEFYWYLNDIYFRARDTDSQCTLDTSYNIVDSYRSICGDINGTHQNFYVGGSLVSSGTCDYDFSDATPNPFLVGVNVYSDVDEVWLFNRTLTDTERSNLINNNDIGYVDPTYCLKATNSTNIYWDSC